MKTVKKFKKEESVSIPYRYGITYKKKYKKGENAIMELKKFQFLIGTVLQQYFRRFLALSSFFLL